MGESSKEKLVLPQRFNQHNKLEEYTIDACSENQKKVLSYILLYFKKWYENANSPKLQKNFTPLRRTLCGVAKSSKSTLVNTLVTAIRKIIGKLTVFMSVVLQDLQLSMLGVKLVTGYLAFKGNWRTLNYQH